MSKILSVAVFLLIINTLYAQKKYSREDYIQQYSQIAIDEMKRVGIPASITLAQGMLESDNGNSTIAREANNHFGIKCHKDWNGETYYHDDDRPNECFRKYKNANQSFTDHSEFLCQHQRYAFLFEYGTTDYKKWAHGLKKAGYATNNNYAEMLIKIIEENKLDRFDDGSYKKERPIISHKTKAVDDLDDIEIDPFGNDIQNENRINFIITREGDTFESVAQRYDMRTWQLYKYNELSKDAKLVVGQRLYLQPKRWKADIKYKFHTVQPGEDMWSISQKYGIKLKHLYRLNSMKPGTSPEVGSSLSLRKKIRKKTVEVTSGDKQ
jgi:LysM repeat protein